MVPTAALSVFQITSRDTGTRSGPHLGGFVWRFKFFFTFHYLTENIFWAFPIARPLGLLLLLLLLLTQYIYIFECMRKLNPPP